jgi:biotin operon repressor
MADRWLSSGLPFAHVSPKNVRILPAGNTGDKLAFAMLLSYAWQNDHCFPGQQRLAEDMGLHETNVRKHLKSLEANGLLEITRRGQGKTNIYTLNLKVKKYDPIKTERKRSV